MKESHQRLKERYQKFRKDGFEKLKEIEKRDPVMARSARKMLGYPPLPGETGYQACKTDNRS